MKTLRMALAALLVGGLAMTGLAGSALSIRLVEASQKGGASSPGLEDVVDILSRNLPYATFTLQAQQSVALPAAQSVAMGGFTLSCSGPQHALQLSVKRGNRVLISTILRLADGTPVIVGGFPSANGKQIFVLVAR